ncbi:MAG: pilin [Microgenomates group bacterium]
MKGKVFSVLFLVIAALFLLQQRSFAQDIIPDIPQPGITCGNPNTTGDTQKCCKSPITTPGAVNLGNPLLDAAYTVMRPLIEKNTNAIIQRQKTVSVKACVEGLPSTPGDVNNDSCICLIDRAQEPISAFDSSCENIKSSTEQGQCKSCSNTNGGVWTALGCFNGNLSDFITKNIMQTGVSIAGGISLLCIMFAAFQMQTSGGNAEKIKKAQELLTNCITGLMVIMFSILILKIIGVDILRLPGFSQ